MISKKKDRRARLLSSTRPSFNRPTSSLSSRQTRSLVRTHHTLRKKLSSALTKKDDATAKALKEQIKASGGLKRYQEASVQGQSEERGGDSSKVLMKWLYECHMTKVEKRLRLLEVGALKPDNACARSGLFDMERIDLHSRHSTIKEEDFMLRPIPTVEYREVESFDIVSLSLVINFEGDAGERGKMLKRVKSFFRRPIIIDGARMLYPTLFLVLPAPCVTNSRYLDESLLAEMMRSMGYVQIKKKMSAKLVYYLWSYDEEEGDIDRSFKKKEINPGKSRNNFAIILG